MKCYLVDGRGIENIKLGDRPAPVIKTDYDVLVDVKACSLNYRDLMIVRGQYYYAPVNEPFIPLSDMAGVVKEVGAKVAELKPGDRVLNAPFRYWPAGNLRPGWASTFIGGGAGSEGVLAEQIVFPADSLVKLPQHVSFAEGSTFTIAGLTAWSAVVTHGKAMPGEWVLLHGTGGVSIFAAQIAQGFSVKTIMTTSDPSKAEYVKKNFGVAATVNYKDADWTKQVMEITQGTGVDIVVDVAGGEVLSSSLKVCNYNARVAVIGVLSGKESMIETRDLLRHQVQIRGIFMESTQELRAFIRAAEAFKLKPNVDKVFSFQDAKEAYKHLESQKHIGKVVIET